MYYCCDALNEQTLEECIANLHPNFPFPKGNSWMRMNYTFYKHLPIQYRHIYVWDIDVSYEIE
jgi:hypothetical protein